MARPKETLQARIVSGKFKARVHAELLDGPLVGPAELQEAQLRFQGANSPALRRAAALEYEKLLRGAGVVEIASGAAAAVEVSPVAAFFEVQLRHVKGPAAGQPFRLEPWQQSFAEEFVKVDRDGQRVFKRGLLGVARGNGKSPLAAGLALRELFASDDAPDVFLAAASRDQARIVFEYARGFVESGPLAGLLSVGRNEIRNPANGGVLRTISADGYVQHGLNPSGVVIDELHAWGTDKQRELFTALDSAIHKRPDAFWLAITTAGHDRTSLLGKLHAEMLDRLELERPTPGLTIGRDEFNGALLTWYGAEGDKVDADDEALWDAVNPASFVTVEALGKQRRSPSMSRSTFARLHLNAWVPAEAERWIETAAWDALAEGGEIEDGATVYIGADGSRSYDTTAIAWACRRADGRVDVDARVFSVRPDVPHHVLHTGTIDFSDVEGFLLELLSRFDVAEVRFDPRFLEATMEAVRGRLPSQAVAPVEPFSQPHRRALQAFERAVLEGTLRHRGDPAVDEQISWTAVDRFENGDVRRLRKLDRSRPIDASVALALAVQGAVLGEGGASIYETRGAIYV